jgi:hypothetical protein
MIERRPDQGLPRLSRASSSLWAAYVARFAANNANGAEQLSAHHPVRHHPAGRCRGCPKPLHAIGVTALADL